MTVDGFLDSLGRFLQGRAGKTSDAVARRAAVFVGTLGASANLPLACSFCGSRDANVIFGGTIMRAWICDGCAKTAARADPYGAPSVCWFCGRLCIAALRHADTSICSTCAAGILAEP